MKTKDIIGAKTSRTYNTNYKDKVSNIITIYKSYFNSNPNFCHSKDKMTLTLTAE